MAEWIRVGRYGGMAEGEMRLLVVAGRQVALALNGGTLHAFHPLCPHASASLMEGDLRPTYVICPLHAYRFDLKTGRCLKPPDGPRLRIYQVEMRGEDLWVEV